MSGDADAAVVVAAAGLGLAAAAVLYAVVPHAPAVSTLALRTQGLVINRNVTDLRPQLALHTREYKPLPAPAGAREVPLFPSGPRTPFPGGTGTRLSTDGGAFREFLAFARQVLRDSGRSDEDVRCTAWLWIKETGWGRACYGYNCGNRKATASTYGSPESIVAGRVWTTRQGATGVYPLIDRINSFDVYNTFGDWAGSARDELALFNWSNYAGVLAGYRAGELEGLLAAQTAMRRGGYSGGLLATQLAECRWYWRIGERLAGAGWVR